MRVRPRQPVASPSRRENAERREGRAARAEPAWRGGGQRAAPPLRKLRAVPSGREAQARPSAAGCRGRHHRTTWTRTGGRRRRAAVAPTALPRARSPPTSGRWSEARPAVALPRCAAGVRAAGFSAAEDRILPRQAQRPLRTHRDWTRGRASRSGLSWRGSRPALLLAAPSAAAAVPLPGGGHGQGLTPEEAAPAPHSAAGSRRCRAARTRRWGEAGA